MLWCRSHDDETLQKTCTIPDYKLPMILYLFLWNLKTAALCKKNIILLLKRKIANLSNATDDFAWPNKVGFSYIHFMREISKRIELSIISDRLGSVRIELPRIVLSGVLAKVFERIVWFWHCGFFSLCLCGKVAIVTLFPLKPSPPLRRNKAESGCRIGEPRATRAIFPLSINKNEQGYQKSTSSSPLSKHVTYSLNLTLISVVKYSPFSKLKKMMYTTICRILKWVVTNGNLMRYLHC